jgi:hypothetical protein
LKNLGKLEIIASILTVGTFVGTPSVGMTYANIATSGSPEQRVSSALQGRDGCLN